MQLYVSVLGSGHDSTNGGVTGHQRCPTQRAILLAEDAPPMAPEELAAHAKRHCAVLRVHDRGGWLGAIAVPEEPAPSARRIGPMFGGHFVYSSDSRFGPMAHGARPLPVHDRYETPEHYALND